MNDQELHNNKPSLGDVVPLTDGGAGQAPSEPTIVQDLGNGLSSGADSVFGSEAPESDFGASYAPNNANTLPFTQAGSAYTTPAKGAGWGSVVPDGTTFAFPSGGQDTAFSSFLDRRQAKPTFIKKGTNHLLPFGCADFIAAIGATDITSEGNLTAAEATCNALIPSLNTPGSYRFVANWKRMSDLKNVVISYFNKSIPFTDLQTADRFAIECCYVRDVAFSLMPIYAKRAALSYVQHLQKSGFQYNTGLLTNLNSLTLERLCKQIYSAVAALPALDEVLFARLDELTRLYVSAKRNGFTPTIISQDVAIGGPGRYVLKKTLAGGFGINTTMDAITSAVVLNATTFHEWMSLWLRADLWSEADVADILSQFLGLAQSIRSNYAIMLSASTQLEARGSVPYKTVSTFVPVKSIGTYTLDYAVVEPCFSYAYKERFEYAPRRLSAEDAGGTMRTVEFNIATLPDSASSAYTGLLCRRPAGLYKGEKCWGTSELAGIGLFRLYSTSLTNGRWSAEWLLAAKLGVTLTTTNNFLGSSAVTSSVYFMDGWLGDVYGTNLGHTAKTADGATSTNLFQSSAPLVEYYGIGDALCAPFATLGSYIADGGTVTTCLSVVKGAQVIGFFDYAMSGSESPYLVTANALVSFLEASDLTTFMSETKNSAGEVNTPIFIMTGYRGAIWDDFDLAPLDNTFADSYTKLTTQLHVKARRSETTVR